MHVALLHQYVVLLLLLRYHEILIEMVVVTRCQRSLPLRSHLDILVDWSVDHGLHLRLRLRDKVVEMNDLPELDLCAFPEELGSNLAQLF